MLTNHPQQKIPKRHAIGAFTLVELLVVIAIIAVLLSMLLPAIRRARESGNRAVCLSNIRQFGIAFQVYATENHNQIPIGYVVGQKQLNYLLWVGSGHNRLTLFGLLTLGKFSPQGRAWYCPSETQNVHLYNITENPWPPGKVPTVNTRAGYGCRPVIDWNNGNFPARFPRLTTLRNSAILADIVSAQDRLLGRHVDGVNVLYGHGGAHWVPRETFKTDLANSPLIFPTNDAAKAVVNVYQDNIWKILDVQ